MTAQETARLIDWLMANGHNAEDAMNCIKFIASGIQPDSKSENESDKRKE